MKKLILIAALVSVSACSVFEGKGDTIVFDKVLGPETKKQIKPLPNDLRGDKAGENLSGEELKGNGAD